MTGYATAQSGGPSQATSETAQPALGLEIRSVNSRFLDLAFKLQDDLRGTEPALRELLGNRLKRGKVEVRAWIEGRGDGSLRAPSPADLQKIVGLQDSIQAWCPKAAPLSVAEVLHLTSRQHSLPGGLHEQLLALAQTALDGLIDARQREGARLAAMLKDRLQQLLGEPIDHFCYPYGSHDDAVVDMVSAAGYRSAVTCDRASAFADADPLRLPRKAISFGDSLAGYAWKLHMKTRPRVDA